MKNVIVLGAGNWGTVLAIELSSVCSVRLWTNTSNDADSIVQSHENERYLPGVKIPDKVIVEEKFNSTIAPDDIIVIVVPSKHMEAVCLELKGVIHSNQIIINASKGLRSDSLKTMSQVIKDCLPNVEIVALTGPTIAREIAEGLPACAVLSCENVEVLLELKKELTPPNLFFEMSRDVEGAELCASLKGLIAIAIGVCDGLKLKTNVQGAVITYGLREFKVIAEFLNIEDETVYGLSGVGDLITTCLSSDSRNRRFGTFRAQGLSLQEALDKVGMVVEGVSMAQTIVELSRFNLHIPLFNTITQIIFEEPESIYDELIATLKNMA